MHRPQIPSFSNENHFFFSDEYRFGFQAQEQDEEMWGGSVTYKYRVEDPRLGRFFAVDPLFFKFPWNSNYAFSENRVTNAVELEGMEALDKIELKSEIYLDGQIDESMKKLRHHEERANFFLQQSEDLAEFAVYRILWEVVDLIPVTKSMATVEKKVVEMTIEETMEQAGEMAELESARKDAEKIRADNMMYDFYTKWHLAAAETEASTLNGYFDQRIYCQLYDLGILKLISSKQISDRIFVASSMSSTNSKILTNGQTFMGFGSKWNTMSETQQWTAVKVFIDTAVENCAEFTFEGGCSAAENSTSSKAIMDYLTQEKGYIWQDKKLILPQ